MSVSIILAMAKNNVIGKGQDLPWKLPEDMKRFKRLTSGNTVLMGRKCYESIPEKFRPLPNRVNVIITRDESYKAEGCEVRHDLQAAIEEFNEEGKELFIIGGAEIYKESFSVADTLYVTHINEEVEGDIVVEGLVEDDWVMVAFDGHYKEDNLTYRFVDYVSKEKFNQQWQKED